MTEEQMIGHYRIVGVLGSGAMGTVRVAVDTFIDRKVAIKSLRPELSHDVEFVSRFRGEAKSLALLNHPNIATLYTPIAEGDDLHLVMELVRGRGLDDILRERGRPLGLRVSLAIIAQAADGLSYAHEMGVIHRDIKPANLMIADDGRVKIMDFGIARVRGSLRLTRSGTAVGTPLYMSPEQCKGGEGDERSDIYALAVVLYEMLSGTPPFQAASEYDLIQAQISATPPPLVPRVPGVTPGLESAVMKALAKRPEQRFQTMRAFADALGATEMRPDATGIVRSASQLVEAGVDDDATAAKAGALAVAKSRVFAIGRNWLGLGGAAKAATAVVALAALGGVVWWSVVGSTGLDAGRRADPPAAPVERSGIDTLRMAIKGKSDAPVHAADFEYVTNGVRVQLLPTVRKLADEGSAEARFVLGMLLLETPGNVDKAGAFDAFVKASEQGYPDAQANLGLMYQKGMTPEGRDLVKASGWFEKAAAAGDGKSQFWLGCYTLHGWGGRARDQQAAVALFGQAIAAHYAPAQQALQDFARGTSGSCGAP